MRRLLLMALVAIVFPGRAHGQAAPSASGGPPNTFSRDSITHLLGALRHIGTPEGIDSLLPLEVNGSTQWVSIRGLNRANPVLLLIHGGPGWPMMPTAWAFQKPWEDYFTVVEWDQRGAGRNFLGTDTAKARGPFTLDQMVSDAEVVIGHVQRMLGKRKVVVMGFSWGTAIGLTLAAKRPDLLHAYVGVGQIGLGRNEKYLYDRTVELATFAHDDSALASLRAIAPYPAADGTVPSASAFLVRKWAGIHNGGWYGQRDLSLFYQLPALAPEYSAADVDAQQAASNYAGRALYDAAMAVDLGRLGPFTVPIFFLHGRYDLFTPFVTARDLFEKLRAPSKKFIPFERSAHFVMFEEPGRFLLTLVSEVLPLTKEGAAFGVAADAPK